MVRCGTDRCRLTTRMRAAARRCCPIVGIALLAGLFVLPDATAAERASAKNKLVPLDALERMLQDDATLFDVQAIGPRAIIAVGAHGTILRSEDAGANWESILTTVGTKVTWRSVWFISDRLGWIAGEDFGESAEHAGGIVASTEDGGRTWTVLSKRDLPGLQQVRFFNPEIGIAIGAASDTTPTGIFTTEDGGETWRAMMGTRSAGWRCAAFLTPDIGVVAGRHGQLRLMGGDQLLPPRLALDGPRTIHGITLHRDETGWAVGDGGLLLTTTSGGVVWDEPPTLPEIDPALVDFRSVESRGGKIWIAGQPGTGIWHSPDQGQTWQYQSTGQSLPLQKVRVLGEGLGHAVGTGGVILRTEDGKQWRQVRGQNRRAAALVIVPRASRIPEELLVKLGMDQGYRCAVWVANRRDGSREALPQQHEDLRVDQAVQRCGGLRGQVAWEYPVLVPGLDRDANKLRADWDRRMEGKFSSHLVGQLKSEIRSWRPSLVIVDQPGADDAVGQLIYQAALEAVQQAAQPDDQATVKPLLAPWKVEQLWQRLGDGSAGPARLDPLEFSPRLNGNPRTIAATIGAWLRDERPALSAPTSPQAAGAGAATPAKNVAAPVSAALTFKRLSLDGTPRDDQSGRELFAGLILAPGSEARRTLLPLEERDLEQRTKLAQKQRNLTVLAEKSLQDDLQSEQWLAHLRPMTDGMTPDQGANTLQRFWWAAAAAGRYELAEDAIMELLRRYPKTAAAREARVWLFHALGSSELTYQRQRRRPPAALTARELNETPTVGQRIKELNGSGITRAGRTGSGDERVTPAGGVNGGSVGGPPLMAGGTGDGKKDLTQQVVQDWQKRALELATQLELEQPLRFASAEIQLPLAALQRTRGTFQQSDAIYRKFGRATALDDPWRGVTDNELWMLQPSGPPPVSLARSATAKAKPFLDGLLSDECWRNAQEITLPSPDPTRGDDPAARTLVMLCHDAEFLYLAAVVPKLPALPTPASTTTGRPRDAELSAFDRLEWALDLDRDYTTAYHFAVDQRGWTADRCWEDRSYNPLWFVACDNDATHWRIEVAIPWNELTPAAPKKGTVFALRLERIAPTIGQALWEKTAKRETESGTYVISRPTAQAFGLLRFEP